MEFMFISTVTHQSMLKLDKHAECIPFNIIQHEIHIVRMFLTIFPYPACCLHLTATRVTPDSTVLFILGWMGKLKKEEIKCVFGFCLCAVTFPDTTKMSEQRLTADTWTGQEYDMQQRSQRPQSNHKPLVIILQKPMTMFFNQSATSCVFLCTNERNVTCSHVKIQGT